MASQGGASPKPDDIYEASAQSAHNEPEVINLHAYDSMFGTMPEAAASLDLPKVGQEDTSCVDAATSATRSTPPSPPHINVEASGDGLGWVGMGKEVIGQTPDCEEDQGIEQQEIDTAQGNDSGAVESRHQTPRLPKSQGIEEQDIGTTEEQNKRDNEPCRHTTAPSEAQKTNLPVPNTNEESSSASLEGTQVPDKCTGNDNNENPNKNVPESSHHIPPLDESISLGHSFLHTPANKVKKTPEQIAQLKAKQRMLFTRLQPQREAPNTNSIFGGPAEASSSRSAEDGSSTRMDLDFDSDEEAAKQFKKVERAFRRKERLGTNTFEDEVFWGKVQAAERARVKRVEAEASFVGKFDSSSDEAAESEDELFITQGNPTSSPHHDHTETTENGDDFSAVNNGAASLSQQDAGGNGEEDDVVDLIGTDAIPSKRQLAAARKQESDNCKQAGIEAFELKEKRKAGRKPNSRKRKAPDGNGHTRVKKVKTGKTKGKGKEKAMPKQPKTKRRTSQHNSLFSSNVFEEANNNLGASPAPKYSGKRKDEALKAMLINVPLENLKQARSESKSILECTKILGPRGRCYHAKDGRFGLKGMTTTLYNYQVQGAAFMKSRELGEAEPLGGMLSDSMGLGKTLMVLACMVANPPLPTAGPKTTLIVCTTSLLMQWEREILKHAKVLPLVLRHHATNRITGPGAYAILEKADVVITTYDEVRKSYPQFRPPKHIVLPEKKREWWEQQFEKMRDVLHRVHWYRIVLDEAQAIKNQDSLTSIACRGLMAKHRWAVSATPITNRVQELFAFFKLLRVKHTGDLETFKRNFCDPKNPDSFARLHTFLRQIMLRRTHADTIMGRPLVLLPRNTQRTIELEFNPVERAIYESVQRCFIQVINQRGREGTLEKSFAHVLLMLLRLRQMTAHPFMLQNTIERLFEVEDIEKLMRLTVPDDIAQKDPSRNMLAIMKKMIPARVNRTDDSPDVGPSTAAAEDNAEDDFAQQLETSGPLVFTFRRFLQNMVKGEKWDELKARSLCHKCRDAPEVPYVTDCYHLYCLECLRALQQEAAVRGEERATCCECGLVFEKASCCTGITELAVDAASSASDFSPTDNAATRRKLEKEDLKWINYGGDVLPSTKTAAVVAQIEEWQREEPHKKIIVFSQFHILMTVLDKMFTQQEWGHVKYNGAMSQRAREKALSDFEDDPNCKIMIASLQAGGVGLNLTMASKVICVDLWWNSSVEQQAFCRVFRIGQESETFITRFVVKNTVDEKLQAMQKEKEAAIRQAIDDDKMLEALTVPELMSLFGDVQLDENQKPFIVVDDDGEFDKEAPPTMLRSRYVCE
ncbi:MAG: hypothetical protein Q9181_002789 [Wetmoreana brouardii]